MTEMGDWTQVLVRVGEVDPAMAADRLWAFGPAAIEERTEERTPEPDEGPVLLVAGFDDAERAASAAAAMESLGVEAVHLRPVTDDGLDAWRAWARIEQAGPFTIVPAWLDVPEEAVGHTIVLDPGRTFGSGSHPTTRLVLRMLANAASPGDRVLDVGCGSGVLAIGAALLGAGRVLGIDIDPEARPTTEANAHSNGVADQVTASDESLSSVAASGERFDVVAANLLAPVVAELASDLVAVLASGATLIVSGLLADRWEATAAVLAPLRVAAVEEEDGWVALVLRQP